MFQIWGIMGTSYSCCRVNHSWQQVIIGAAADQESGVASGQGQGDLLERVPGGLGLLLAFLPCQSCSQHLGLGKALLPDLPTRLAFPTHLNYLAT